MSGVGRGGGTPFSGRTIFWVILVGVVAFGGLLLLGAYGPDLNRSRNGGAHPLSISAVGYKGLVDLIGYSGGKAALLRDERALATEDLLILTPEISTSPDEIAKRVESRLAKPTLIVLPKWRTQAQELHRGWVQKMGMVDATELDALIAKIGNARIATIEQPEGASTRLRATGLLSETAAIILPDVVHRIEGKSIEPLLVDDKGRMVLAGIGGRKLYILAEPDLLANHGLKSAATARAALAMLDDLNATGAEAIAFDLTLNGFGSSKNLLKLGFEPPFLALTLSLLGAALLAGLHAAARFGPARDEERAISFGKLALVENVAALIVRARREASTGWRYALLTREAVAMATGAPQRADEATLIAYLDRLGDGQAGTYSALAEDARLAADRDEVLAAARALYHWRRKFVREG
ncbi:hypothetical protein CLG96_14660 [Sphingomonas oleivorans]|uniref:DUF4350 domain-containing protein n=1 Tax=Sphingomonas oleivorans TaxID=1735121 RepID=A0A2T5FVG5_9SPHN|nr:hypothetical protein [Sphingomonas oleivorans]PTQ09431.1 hypothetical protein CLG96_14660 [Sphingomonas oleivorans]